MAKERPLWDRLYVQPHLTDLVRLVGYQGLGLEEAREKIKALIDKHGKDKIVAGSWELYKTDEKTVTLTAEARHLAWQLLGPPPEYKETDMIAEIMARGERLKGDPTPEAKPVKQKKPPRAKKTVSSTTAKPTTDNPAQTPLMQQYRDAKERHPGMLLLFRMGDFYEMFEQDAETAARFLGLTLTSRDKTTAMAGFPHHQLENYLRKLLQAGHRVAVCDQVVDAEPVGREVTRVVTPGTMTDPVV